MKSPISPEPADGNRSDLKTFLDLKYQEYHKFIFIQNDPVSVPHRYSTKQDIEITGFWTSILYWGQRKTIISKATELFSIMGQSPYEFVLNHRESDLIKIQDFRHRTFNGTDALYFIHFFNRFYREHVSLEELFIPWKDEPNLEGSLNRFQEIFFSLPEAPDRTHKHISSPARGSACKRLNMFLRWMVRMDKAGIDFGIWRKIRPDQLICPCDVHVERVARKLGLITGRRADWKAAMELTENLKKFDPSDPVKYDYALFGLGVSEKF